MCLGHRKWYLMMVSFWLQGICTAFSWILEWLGSETVKRIFSIQGQGYKLGIDCHTNKLWICIYFHSVCLKTHSMDLKGSSKSLETVATKQSKPVWYIQRLIHQLKAELSTWQTSSKYLLNELMIQHAEIPNFTYYSWPPLLCYFWLAHIPGSYRILAQLVLLNWNEWRNKKWWYAIIQRTFPQVLF